MNLKKAPKSNETIVLEHLQQAGSITHMEAEIVYGIRSVSRRITELQRRGVLIRKETRFDGNGQRYVRYHYVGQASLPIRMAPVRLFRADSRLPEYACAA